jgi:hypothetical protein
VWWDPDIPPGEIWDELIEQELANVSCVVVLWSATSIQKQWVKAEATEAQARGILGPRLHRECKAATGLPANPGGAAGRPNRTPRERLPLVERADSVEYLRRREARFHSHGWVGSRSGPRTHDAMGVKLREICPVPLQRLGQRLKVRVQKGCRGIGHHAFRNCRESLRIDGQTRRVHCLTKRGRLDAAIGEGSLPACPEHSGRARAAGANAAA